AGVTHIGEAKPLDLRVSAPPRESIGAVREAGEARAGDHNGPLHPEIASDFRPFPRERRIEARACWPLAFAPVADEAAHTRSIRRADERGHVGLGLAEDGAGVAESLEPFASMVSTHARGADAPKRQIFLCDMEDHVIDGNAARGRARENVF